MAAAVAVMTFLLASGCSGDGDAGVPFEDDFSDPKSGWSTDKDDSVSFEYTEGGYRILLKRPARPQTSILLFEPSIEALSVEVDATQRTGPRDQGDELHGVGCWASQAPSTGYLFNVRNDGSYVILREDEMGGEVVKEGSAPDVISGFGAKNRIRGDCVGEGQVATRLTLYVNGKKLAEARDGNGFNRFAGVALYATSLEPGTDVLFDNLVARQP